MTDTDTARLEERFKALEKEVARLAQSVSEIWKALDEIRNRPPVWATAIIVILSSVATGLIVRAFS